MQPAAKTEWLIWEICTELSGVEGGGGRSCRDIFVWNIAGRSAGPGLLWPVTRGHSAQIGPSLPPQRLDSCLSEKGWTLKKNSFNVFFYLCSSGTLYMLLITCSMQYNFYSGRNPWSRARCRPCNYTWHWADQILFRVDTEQIKYVQTRSDTEQIRSKNWPYPEQRTDRILNI